MKKKHQIIVIGAGPAGLQLSYYLKKNSHDHLILESTSQAGSFFVRFPRNRSLISINKLYTGICDRKTNMRFDWNSLKSDEFHPLFKDFLEDYFPAADRMVEYLNAYAKEHKLKIRYNTRVTDINRFSDGLFELNTESGEAYLCEILVIATGLKKPFIPDIEGIEYAVHYTECSMNPKDYKNERVLILGKGNSAFETADILIPTTEKIHLLSPSSVKFAWKTHFVGNLRAVNNNFLDTYQLKSQNALIDGNIEKIEKTNNGDFRVNVAYLHANNEVEELFYDHIIACTGFEFDTSIFNGNICPDLTINDRFPSQKSNWESTNVNNLFFAGALTQVRDYKKQTSAFIHGFRYNCFCLDQILSYQISGKEWNNRVMDLSISTIAHAIIENVNRTSSLWQQFGFIGDAVWLDFETNKAKYYQSIPIDYAKEYYLKGKKDFLIITLEYGNEIFEKTPSPFEIERVHRNDVANADQSAFLHPIVRRFRKGILLNTHHIIEDFENHWCDEKTHIQPLIKFLEGQLIVGTFI